MKPPLIKVSLYKSFTRSTRIAFKTASSVTPTSEKTASHIVAIPKAPSSKTNPFTPNAKIIFCHTMRLVRFAMFTAVAILKAHQS